MNLDELLKSNIGSVWRDDDNFYVKINASQIYNETMYVVNLKTKDVSIKSFLTFMFDNLENSVESSKEEFRETFSK